MPGDHVAKALVRSARTVKAHPDDPEAWAALGAARRGWKDLAGAIEAYERASQLAPDEPSHYVELAGIYQAWVVRERAILKMERVVSLRPDRPDYRASLAALLIQSGRMAEAEALLEEGRREHPEYTLFQSLLAYCRLHRAEQSWTRTEDGIYATTRRHVREALAWVEKAGRLRFRDEDLVEIAPGFSLSETIRAARRDIAAQRARRFHGSRPVAVVSIALGLLMISTGGGENLGGGLAILACGILYVVSCFTPQFVVNRRVLSGSAGTGALTAEGTGTCVVQRDFFGQAGGKEEKRGGRVTGLIVSFFIIAFLPVIVPWNFGSNWLLPAISE